MKFTMHVLILASCLASFVGCSSLSKTRGLQSVSIDSAVELKLSPEVGRRERVQFYSHSVIKGFEKSSLVREKEELADFTVVSNVTDRDPNTGAVSVVMETIQKDGPVILKDLAFPELGEKLNMVFNPQAQVLSAGDYPKESLFYLPPIPLPDRPVSVGDTWPLRKRWQSMNNGMLMALDIITILKGFYACPGESTCADLEISGGVELLEPQSPDLEFSSEVRGRFLMNIKTGSIVWSQVSSNENMITESDRVQVKSCLVSALQEPAREKLVNAADLRCRPGERAEKAPGA